MSTFFEDVSQTESDHKTMEKEENKEKTMTSTTESPNRSTGSVKAERPDSPETMPRTRATEAPKDRLSANPRAGTEAQNPRKHPLQVLHTHNIQKLRLLRSSQVHNASVSIRNRTAQRCPCPPWAPDGGSGNASSLSPLVRPSTTQQNSHSSGSNLVCGPTAPTTRFRLINEAFVKLEKASIPQQIAPSLPPDAEVDGYKILHHAVQASLSVALGALVDRGLPCVGQGESHLNFVAPIQAYMLRDEFMTVSCSKFHTSYPTF